MTTPNAAHQALLAMLMVSLAVAPDANQYGAYLALLPEIQPPWN